MNIRPLIAAVVFAASVPASANLPIGAVAPAFATQGAKGGKPFALNLRTALSKGPVVLYFYPKAFTKGCTLEAKAFADATAALATAAKADDKDAFTAALASTNAACKGCHEAYQAPPPAAKAG